MEENKDLQEIARILKKRGYSWEEIGDILYELQRLIPTPWAQEEIFEVPGSDAAMRRGLSPVQVYLEKLKGEL